MKPSFYRVRLVKAGPWLPAAIYRPCPFVKPAHDIDPAEWCRPYDRPRNLAAMIGDDMPRNAEGLWVLAHAEEDPIAAEGYGVLPAREAQEITSSDYFFRVAEVAWLKQYRPDSPEANPAAPVPSVAALPPVF